jgi:hypothetical protein
MSRWQTPVDMAPKHIPSTPDPMRDTMRRHALGRRANELGHALRTLIADGEQQLGIDLFREGAMVEALDKTLAEKFGY